MQIIKQNTFFITMYLMKDFFHKKYQKTDKLSEGCFCQFCAIFRVSFLFKFSEFSAGIFIFCWEIMFLLVKITLQATT